MMTQLSGQLKYPQEAIRLWPMTHRTNQTLRPSLIDLEGDYNNNIPPIGKNTSEGSQGSLIPARVSISITLMKVVEIEETDHSIHLQFQISLQWRENRVSFQNLKFETSLNALSAADIDQLWLPLVIYDNTDQQESTRLGDQYHTYPFMKKCFSRRVREWRMDDKVCILFMRLPPLLSWPSGSP